MVMRRLGMAVTGGTRRIVGGVDTHKDLHVAAVVDEQGRVIGTRSFATTRQGYVDSELSCPVLVAPHMSASSGSVLPRGTVGNALALSTFPQAAPPSGVRRRIFHRGAASAPRSRRSGRCIGGRKRRRAIRPDRR